jgi:itaconyl-CoA hydratase
MTALERFAVGQHFRSDLGRTIIEADNVWFTALTHNTNQLHFNAEYATASAFERPLVNSCLTLALVTGLSVADVSAHAIANLGWDDVRLPRPVFVGDTLWAETEVLAVRPSATKPDRGVLMVSTSGVNQHDEVVITFRRTIMLPRCAGDEGAAS